MLRPCQLSRNFHTQRASGLTLGYLGDAGRSTEPPSTAKMDPGTSKQAKYNRVADSNCEEWGMYNFKAKIAYKGTRYRGWQIQNGPQGAMTVQQAFETALHNVKGESRRVMRLQGAGRTDAGVHARGQIVNFYSNKLTPPVEKMVKALNAHLPKDIRVLQVQRVPPDFSARYSALSKVYSFRIQMGPILDVFQHGLCQQVPEELNLHAMRLAAQSFVGRHDFKQFSSVPDCLPAPNPVKNIFRVEVEHGSDGFILKFHGSGFLYNQCRHMTGCLIQIGLGALPIAHVAHLLQIGSSQHPGLKYRGWPLAQPQGLYLDEVHYPPHDDPLALMYPGLVHDQYGRVWTEAMAPGEEKTMIQLMKQQGQGLMPSDTN